MKKSEVDEIVLVGGSTRIPKIQNLIKDYFGGKEPSRGINPDDAVAYGAAVQGGILGGSATEETSGILFIDVTPLTLGIETAGGVMAPIIKRGTVIPAKQTKTFTTHRDQQTMVKTSVYEGERPLTKDNHLLGEFDVTGIPPAPKGVPKFAITFELDENSILTVQAIDQGTGKGEGITITNDKGRLSKEEIEKMVAEAEKFAEEDKLLKERIDSKQSLTNYIDTMRRTIEDKDKLADKLDDDDKSAISDALWDAELWMDANDEKATGADFDEHLKELQRVCDPIIGKIYQQRGGQSNDDDWDDEEFEDL